MKTCWHTPLEWINFDEAKFSISKQIDLTPSATQIQTHRTILTWEQLFLGVTLTFASILRLANLGRTPLSPAEADNALGTWQFWQPSAGDFVPEVGSAAWFSLTALLTQLAGDGDGIMRLVPALAGIAAILTIARFKTITGRVGGVVASLLLAVSPLMISASRTANGNSLAILALIMVASLAIDYRQTGSHRSMVLLAGWLAFGATTAPIFYTGFITFLGANLLASVLGPELNWGSLWPTEFQRRQLGIVFIAVFAASSTMFLLNLAGIGITAGILETWLSAFGGFSNVLAWGDPILALAQYELFFIVMAIVSLLILSFLRDSITSYLGHWLMGSVIMLFLQVGNLENALVVLIPAALIVGRAVDITLAQVPMANWFSTYPDGGMGFPMAGIALILLLIATTNLGRVSKLGLESTEGQGNYFFVLVCLLMVFAITVVVLVYDRQSAAIGLLTIGLVASIVYGWGVGWRLGGEHANDTRELWVQLHADDELRLLEDTLAETGSSTRGIDEALEIFSTVDSPLMRWYLRHYPRVQFLETIQPTDSPDVIITPDGIEISAGSDYTGTDFGIGRTNQDLRLNFIDGLRWWFFGDSAPDIEDRRIILWVRTDLITN